MRGQTNGALVVTVILAVGLLADCGRFFQKPLSPTSGATTVEDLVAAYREAHLSKDPERLRNITLTGSLPTDWIPRNGKAELQGLFKLELEKVLVIEMPPGDQSRTCLGYVSLRPQGNRAVDILGQSNMLGKLVLIGRRPDGQRVEVDPGFGLPRRNGRIYLEMLTQVTEEAARAVQTGCEPRYRAIPLGTEQKFSNWTLHYSKYSWAEALSKLDELEHEADEQMGKAPRPNKE